MRQLPLWTTTRQLRLLFFVLLLSSFILGIAAEEECNASKPCALGCCSKFGFCGYGKDYCAKDVCVNNCDSKAECDPGGFGDAYVEKPQCPLNVCCSKYGFCGTDSKFCGEKTVKRPNCSLINSLGGGGMQRVVGYYEAWSPTRPCNTFYPEQIPLGVYTHLNFAFATINPNTFELELGSSLDERLLSRLAGLKKFDPDLKVFIAVGGWTFNDPGPTATVFSDIAASDANSDKFIKSVIRLLTAYDLDGIDLDWEYPGAKDRSGRDEDFKNFPAFLKKLKSALKVTGGRDGVSITLPASYWYLQHFDIKEIQKHTDFLNMMTYDFHGTWDMGNQWVGPYLNAHTNLTEIWQSLDLLWRNDINPEKVVLGLAFYGRVFTVADAGCTAPGCRYASGGERLACSGEISVALNSEITDIMEKTGAKPTLDKDAAVQILKYGDSQWVTFDDEETLAARVDFARNLCLGGVMVWAVSHDTPDATFSLAVGRASKRKASYINVKLVKSEDEGYDYKVDKNPQCMWTNCLDGCPSGWMRMKRSDGDRSDDNEFMISLQSCMGHGKRQLCCPPDKPVFDCGWYNHHNGKCKSTPLPITDIEIGSTNAHCRSGYQAASCSVAMDAMQLWNTCGWSKDWPKCDGGSCENGRTELFSSHSGSGGADCSGKQKRKYCCDPPRQDMQWTNCRWYEHAGDPFPGTLPDFQCLGGCPNDKYAVSLESKGGGCRTGARAMCCENGYQTREKRLNDVDQELAYMLDQFLPDAKCSSDPDSNLGRAQTTIITSLQRIMYSTTTAATRLVWDSRVTLYFEHLTAANIAVFAKKDGSAISLGLDEFPERLLCAMNFYNSRIGGKTEAKCECTRANCCSNNLCPRDDSAMVRRGLEYGFNPYNVSMFDDDEQGGFDLSLYARDDDDLEKRGDESLYEWKAFSTFLNKEVSGSYTSITYKSKGKWSPKNDIWTRAVDYISTACAEFGVTTVALTKSTSDGFVTEHVFERQAIKSFIITTISGKLPSGKTSKYSGLDPSFWTSTMEQTDTTRAGVNNKGTSTYMGHLMNALGSSWNQKVLALAGDKINGQKLQLWRQVPNPVGDIANNRRSAIPYVNLVRRLISALTYLNNPVIRALLVAITDALKGELSTAEAIYFAANNIKLDMKGRFNEWFIDFLQFQQATVSRIVNEETTEGTKIWGTQTGDDSNTVLEILHLAKEYMDDFSFDKAIKTSLGWQ